MTELEEEEGEGGGRAAVRKMERAMAERGGRGVLLFRRGPIAFQEEVLLVGPVSREPDRAAGPGVP